MFQTKKDSIACSKLIINEFGSYQTRSDNVYFANNNKHRAQPLTVAFYFVHAEHSLIKLRLHNN